MSVLLSLEWGEFILPLAALHGDGSLVVSLCFVMAVFPFDDLHNESTYSGFRAYGVSKLANILFARSLSQATARKQVYVNSCHPGLVKTNVFRGVGSAWGSIAQGITDFLLNTVAYNTADGALTQLYLATSPEVESKDIRGQYFVPIADPRLPQGGALNNTEANTLMDWTLTTLEKAGYAVHNAAALRDAARLPA